MTAEQITFFVFAAPLVLAAAGVVLFVALAKTFPIYERMKGQFRAETYNAMNHPSFANPNLTPTNSSFGVSGQTNSEPRNWQFALRITF